MAGSTLYLRRTKEQVASELPPKPKSPTGSNSARRNATATKPCAWPWIKGARRNRPSGAWRSQIVILEALLKLRQACCDLRLLGDEADSNLTSADSGKLSGLLEMLDELFAEGRRVLLFSQFTSMLALIEAELKTRNILRQAHRSTQDPAHRCSSSRRRVADFLISLKAGGAGLNLTAADTVIHFDPRWNPAAEASQ